MHGRYWFENFSKPNQETRSNWRAAIEPQQPSKFKEGEHWKMSWNTFKIGQGDLSIVDRSLLKPVYVVLD